MGMKRCEECGEMYSITYKTCPFCEEEESIRRGKPIRRHAMDYRNKKGGHALGILAMIAVLLLAGWGVWHVWGDNISDALGIRETTVIDNSSDTDGDGITSVTNPNAGDDVTMPGDDAVTPPDDTIGDNVDGSDVGDGNDVQPPVTADPPETSVSLSTTDFTLFSAGETATVTASGGSGSYTWSVDKTLVAVVSGSGESVTVKAIGGGTATLTVSDGFTTATCTVRVRGAAASGDNSTPSGTLELNREDMTLAQGESFQMKVSGTSSAVTWSIADSSVASISGSGVVKGLSSGVTTLTASVDGQTFKCIVRVR